MKRIFVIATCLICFINNLYSLECDKDKNGCEQQWDYSRKYISYVIGISNFFDIYVAEGDSLCDVLILDSKGWRFYSTCQKTPILKWAFDNAANEATKYPAIADKNCSSVFAELSIHNDGKQIILSPSGSHIDYPDEFKTKINELRAFMIDLLVNIFYKEYPGITKPESSKE